VRRWRDGDSISVISRALSKPRGSVFTVLKHHGGIAPAERVRRADRLTAEERESISRGLEAGASLRSIAVSIGRPASTVNREVARNGGRGKYRAVAAEQRAQEQTRRPKPSALQNNPMLRRLVIELLENERSPEQIVGHLRLVYLDNPLLRISHESIYRAVYTTRWKMIPRELCTKLRTGRPIRPLRVARASVGRTAAGPAGGKVIVKTCRCGRCGRCGNPGVKVNRQDWAFGVLVSHLRSPRRLFAKSRHHTHTQTDIDLQPEPIAINPHLLGSYDRPAHQSDHILPRPPARLRPGEPARDPRMQPIQLRRPLININRPHNRPTNRSSRRSPAECRCSIKGLTRRHPVLAAANYRRATRDIAAVRCVSRTTVGYSEPRDGRQQEAASRRHVAAGPPSAALAGPPGPRRGAL
jgi:hypothetical protein